VNRHGDALKGRPAQTGNRESRRKRRSNEDRALVRRSRARGDASIQPEVERISSDPTTAVSSINQPRSVGLEAPAAGAEESPARSCPGQSPSSFSSCLRSRCRRPSSPSPGTIRLGSSASASGSEVRLVDTRISYFRPLAPVTRTLFVSSRRATQAPWSRRRARAPLPTTLRHEPRCLGAPARAPSALDPPAQSPAAAEGPAQLGLSTQAGLASA
jgi:hypothetical protein